MSHFLLNKLVVLSIGIFWLSTETLYAQKDIDTIIDFRDKHTYKTVKIKTQVWMKENLAYSPKSGKYWAWGNDTSNVSKYGYLYDWQTAKRVCPKGWHLPSITEWDVLINYLNNDTLNNGEIPEYTFENNANTWTVSEIKFSLYPCGGYRDFDGKFYCLSKDTSGSCGWSGWWSSTISGLLYAHYCCLNNNHLITTSCSNSQMAGYSVRCIKD